MIEQDAGAEPTRVFVFDDCTPPIERATVADPFRVDAGALRPRTAVTDYALVPSMAEAEVAALPVHWDVYGPRFRHEALDGVATARGHGLDTIVWVNGDHEADIRAPGVIQFQHAAQRIRPGRLTTVRCYPVFIDDRLPIDEPVHRQGVGDRPLVGFCGHAGQTVLAATRSLGSKLVDRVTYRIGRKDRHPEPLASHISLRQGALRALADSSLIDTEFITRDIYRAGIVDRNARGDPNEPTNRAFTDNIRTTDYTLCVRGGGNFSTRVFEAMALGRIPVVVDSGSMMPCEDGIDWHELAVVVDENDLADLPERLAGRHEAVGPAGVQDWQRRCRAAWVEWLSLEGFFSRFGSTVTGRI